jgi:hypothetical protein
MRAIKDRARQPGQIKPPTATEVDVIVAEKGGFGTRLAARPNPHTTHIPEVTLQVVHE